MELARIQLIITGKVQGVGYRISARREAERLSISGWVENKPNGHVEIMAEGYQQQLNQLITWAQNGPQFANVDDIVINNLTAHNEFDQFSIR